jgi:hypothetical protein
MMKDETKQLITVITGFSVVLITLIGCITANNIYELHLTYECVARELS